MERSMGKEKLELQQQYSVSAEVRVTMARVRSFAVLQVNQRPQLELQVSAAQQSHLQ